MINVRYVIFFYILFFLLENNLNAMMYDEIEECNDEVLIKKQNPFLINFTDFPQELIINISYFLEPRDLLSLRRTTKVLKNLIDSKYWLHKKINIISKSSFPMVNEIKSIPFSNICLSFEKWDEASIKELLFFKQVTHLQLKGLESWDFSTTKLFNPSLYDYFSSFLTTLINFASYSISRNEIFSKPSLFLNVTFLDLSNSKIGDFGVTSFVSHFKKLNILNISDNNIGKNLIGEVNAISKISTLTSLNIRKNHFSNQSAEQLANLTNLTFLDISLNPISDKFTINKIKQLPKLNELIIN